MAARLQAGGRTNPHADLYAPVWPAASPACRSSVSCSPSCRHCRRGHSGIVPFSVGMSRAIGSTSRRVAMRWAVDVDRVKILSYMLLGVRRHATLFSAPRLECPVADDRPLREAEAIAPVIVGGAGARAADGSITGTRSGQSALRDARSLLDGALFIQKSPLLQGFRHHHRRVLRAKGVAARSVRTGKTMSDYQTIRKFGSPAAGRDCGRSSFDQCGDTTSLSVFTCRFRRATHSFIWHQYWANCAAALLQRPRCDSDHYLGTASTPPSSEISRGEVQSLVNRHQCARRVLRVGAALTRPVANESWWAPM